MTEDHRQQDRWSRVKKKISEIWDDLSDEELEQTKGNISAISHLVLKKHDVSKQEVATRIVEILHYADNEDEYDEINVDINHQIQ